MAKTLKILLSIFFPLLSSTAFSQDNFSSPIEIIEPGKAELHYMSAADYNDDKVLDLIVGNFEGKLSIKINSGNKSAPVFNPKKNLQAAGEDITIPHW